jgi:hypothetical protein
MDTHGYLHPFDPQMFGSDFDTRDVLRHVIAPAADDVTQLRVHPYGRGLDGILAYAYIPLRSRVDTDSVLTLINNNEAFYDVKKHWPKHKGVHEYWLQTCQHVRD